MKQHFIIVIWVCIVVVSSASAADLRSMLDSKGDLQLLEEDAQFVVQVKTDYHHHDSDSNSSEKRTFVTLDIHDGDEGIQSPRSCDIDICRKRCLCAAICAASSLVGSAVIYVVTQWYTP